MANNVQPIFHLPPFLSINGRCRSRRTGLRTRNLLNNSTIDFDAPSDKYGAIGSGRPQPATPAQTSNFTRLPPIYTAAGYHTPAQSTTSDQSSGSSSSSRKVTFEPGVQLPTRSSPEQRADFNARAREMVDDEATTSIEMMVALALYGYYLNRLDSLLHG